MREPDRMVYQGYLILKNHFTDTWYVSKGGAHIAAAATLTEAKLAIGWITQDQEASS
jgi:hypothetical protein